MTVLEFASHLESGVRVHISDIATNCYSNVRVDDLETEGYSGWHGLTVMDWYFSRNGVCYLEVKDV